MIKSFDWSHTAMGPQVDWSPRVRSIVDACALSPMPMLSLWGRDGLTVYNEAFRSIVGDLDAKLLGLPVLEAWPEAAALMQRIVTEGLRGECLKVENRALVVREAGLEKTRWFDLSCSPVVDENGAAIGVLCIAVERPSAQDDGPARPPDLDHARSRQSLLLKVADEFRSVLQRDEVIAIALTAIDQEVGATSIGHAEVDLAQREAAFDEAPAVPDAKLWKGSLPIERLALGRIEDLRQGHSVVLDQVGTNEPERGGETSRLVVPLVRDKRLRALFVVDRPAGGLWPAPDISLVEDIASRAWEAIDRVQSAATLRRNQARQGFLLVLGDRLRELEDPDEIMETTAESLGRHLKVARAGYGEVSMDHEVFFSTGWSDGSVPPLVGHLRLDSLGEANVGNLNRGLTATFEPAIAPHSASPAIVRGLRTLMVVPLIRDGKLRGVLVLGSRADRRWSADEVSLVGEVAARLWEALERARAEAALHDLNATLENRVAQRTQELTTSEARFRTLFANAPAPIFLIRVSAEDEAVYDAVNAATERFMGTSALDLVGRAVSQRTSTGEALHDYCLRSALTGQPVDYEMSIETEGVWRTAECVLAPLPIEDDDTQLLIGIARDITAQRNAEEQLRQAQKMEAIGQLTGGIAHDFNNLLTGIIGSLALMEKRLAQGRTDVIARYLDLAMTSANRAAALTHRLLAFSRRQPLEAKPVDVSALVISMDDLLRRTLGESVVLETIGPNEIWLTLCDPHQLENALLNLAINARDAMPDGGRLTLETANTSVDAVYAAREPGITPGDYVILAVTDTGTGMPQDVIARAFDPFFTTKPIGQGTGLGLSMIYGFAKQSEGHVKIYSEVGHGTTVKIFLPRSRGRSDTGTEEAAGAVPMAEAGETVLVVEDDETVRSLVLEVLEDLGYLAIEAADGTAGLRILLSGRPVDLLITDVGLPGMNGRQLAEQARTYRPELNVLFITGYAENATFGSGHLEAGMQMMTKPFAVEELATRIRSILEKNGGSVKAALLDG